MTLLLVGRDIARISRNQHLLVMKTPQFRKKNCNYIFYLVSLFKIFNTKNLFSPKTHTTWISSRQSKGKCEKKDVFLLNHHESQQYVHSSILPIKNQHLQSIQLSLITKYVSKQRTSARTVFRPLHVNVMKENGTIFTFHHIVGLPINYFVRSLRCEHFKQIHKIWFNIIFLHTTCSLYKITYAILV